MEPTQVMTAERAARFWAKVDRRGPSDCWEWTASISGNGYGQFRTGGVGTSPVGAHRVAYELLVGPIAAGLQIDHLCRNTVCVNPAHMEPVTPQINTLRSTSPTAVNGAKTHCIHGHEFTPENTRPHPHGRQCRTCLREASRRARARKRAARM